MIGFRHHAACICGCQFVIGIKGEVIESVDDLSIVRFPRRFCCDQPQLVAYENLCIDPSLTTHECPEYGLPS